MNFSVAVYATDRIDVGKLDEEYIIKHNFVTNEIEKILVSEFPQYNYNNTRECLSAEEKYLSQQADQQYALATMNSRTVSSGSEYTVSPNDPNNFLYSGVVLVVYMLEDPATGYQFPFNIGSGFMVNNHTVVSARHCISPELDNPDSDIWDAYDYAGIRIYYGVDVTCTDSNPVLHTCLNSYPYTTVVDASYSSAYESYDTPHDWCVMTTADDINGVYYFSCNSIESYSVLGWECWSVGYPNNNQFRMREISSEVTGVYNSFNNIKFDYPIYSSMSGGPVYTYDGGRYCCAINRASKDGVTWATMINNEIINVIYDRMLNY